MVDVVGDRMQGFPRVSTSTCRCLVACITIAA